MVYVLTFYMLLELDNIKEFLLKLALTSNLNYFIINFRFCHISGFEHTDKSDGENQTTDASAAFCSFSDEITIDSHKPCYCILTFQFFVDTINVALDTIIIDIYTEITRFGKLEIVLDCSAEATQNDI